MQTLNVPKQRAYQPDRLRGVSVADQRSPITTLHQFGGEGFVLNKALVIPMHIGSPVASIEYVSVLAASSVGEHQRHTDEIYFIEHGAGELTTNGNVSHVREGDLVIAPRGTVHAIRNAPAMGLLNFLVIEVFAPAQPICPPAVIPALPLLLHPDCEQQPTRKAYRRQQHVPFRLAEIALSACFSGPWGMLTLFELSPGSQTEPYSLPDHDENLFLVQGHAGVVLEGLEAPFLTDEDPESLLNVFVPAGLQRQVVNRSITETLVVLSVQIRHA